MPFRFPEHGRRIGSDWHSGRGLAAISGYFEIIGQARFGANSTVNRREFITLAGGASLASDKKDSTSRYGIVLRCGISVQLVTGSDQTAYCASLRRSSPKNIAGRKIGMIDCRRWPPI